ncbi:MAG: 23S rRNA (pseudouridine(1915)-N(3))-methyltransferase RlmH [Thermoanaerobaculales bacterium]|nr:23S rRNA (pseudouridine(1915)-N(3))-methyltransferase RlmH [Thermoanaerobaculales bacterium]
MRLGIFWFGYPARSPYEIEIENYRRRVCRRWPAEDHPLRPHGRGRKDEPSKVRVHEAAVVRGRHPRGWSLMALDEAGRTFSSQAFADLLRQKELEGRTGITLVIGSDLGLDQGLLKEADTVLSLGPMTLPHQLARLVLWEQLFRATDILGSGRYHRDGDP